MREPHAPSRFLVGKVTHDLAGAVHGVRSALALLLEAREDPELWLDAVSLARQGIADLEGRLEVCRVAYGGAAVGGARDLDRLTQGAFSSGRGALVWGRLDAGFPAPAAAAALVLAQVAAAALANGGQAQAELEAVAAGWRVRITAKAPKVRAPPGFEAGATGLACEAGAEGWWAAGAHLRGLIGPDGRLVIRLGPTALHLEAVGRPF
jgi:hypothetical protein